jgi:hypothetical protein
VSDDAISFIVKIMNDPAEPTPIRLAAAKDLADRAGLSGKQQIEVTTPQWQHVLGLILVDAPERPDTSERIIDSTYEELSRELEEGPSLAELEPAPQVVEDHTVAADVRVPKHTAERLGWLRR